MVDFSDEEEWTQDRLDGEFPLGDGDAETEAFVECPYCGETNEITKPSREAAEPRSAKIIDLAELLKKSLAEGAPRKKTATGKATASKTGTARKAALRVVTSERATAKTAARRKRA